MEERRKNVVRFPSFYVYGKGEFFVGGFVLSFSILLYVLYVPVIKKMMNFTLDISFRQCQNK